MRLSVARFTASFATGSVALTVVGLLASGIAPVASEFGIPAKETTSLQRLAIDFFSLFAATVLLFGLGALGLHLLRLTRGKSYATWLYTYFAFFSASYWILSLHSLVLGASSGDHLYSLFLFDLLEVLLISSLASVLWPLVLPRHRNIKGIVGTFAATLGVLLLGLAFWEPDFQVYVSVAIGWREQPFDLVVRESFLERLPYVAPVGTILWSSLMDAWIVNDSGYPV
jgi:hypothetical protein